MESPSRIQDRLLDGIMQAHDREDPDIGYTPHALVQAALPYKNPGDVPVWAVQNGAFSLVIQPGWDLKANQTIGYPYGSIPRLLMYWMTTEAKIKKSRRLELGGSLNEFLKKIGLSKETGGGKRSDAKRLKEQMHRLFLANISFEHTNTINGVDQESWVKMSVTSKGQVLWSSLYPDCPSLFENWIELNETFYEAIVQKAVPVDLEVVRAIKHSPMALDLYTWLNYRSWRAWKTNKVIRVPWGSIKKQLGSRYTRLRDFKSKARQHLKEITLLVPDLDIEEGQDYLLIKPSRPAISSRS